MKRKVLKKMKAGKGIIQLSDDGNYSYIEFKYGDNVHHILKSTMSFTLKDYFDSIKITDQRDDAVQFCYSHDEDFWVYFEYEYLDDTMHELDINLRKYSIEEKKLAIDGFYASLEEVQNIYGNDSNQIIAECIFENSIY